MKDKRTSFPTSVRLDGEEKELLKALVEHFGKTSISKVSENDVIKLAIRELAERKGVQMAQKLAQTLERYLRSNDFRQGVIDSTKASWGGSSYKVEISPDGTWQNLWANQIGNRYESDGVIIALPALGCEDMAEFAENGGTEEEYLNLGFDNERDVIESELRDALKASPKS